MTTILVIEDDQILQETLRYNLEQAGFAVETAGDGIRGLELARRARPDLILLDVMLPGLDGFSVCRTLASEMMTPIIMVTALRDEAHVIAGLELGANDYIVKPFSLGELLARVRALLRWNERQAQNSSATELRVGPLRLDRNSRRVWYAEREVGLSHKEFDLLACLMRSAGVALSRDLLLERVWGEEFMGSHRTIDVHVRWLREKIEPDPSNPVLIHTVRGIGYRLEDLSSTEGTRGRPEPHERSA
ncbi:MAG TPA: response regulator transcription factor [Roseiflexaceae bacterium]|nr:response regulator transcription factor [Roseiflexaceae bacterium]